MWQEARLGSNPAVTSATHSPRVYVLYPSSSFPFPGPFLVSVRDVRGLCWEKGWAAEEAVRDGHYEQRLGLAGN